MMCVKLSLLTLYRRLFPIRWLQVMSVVIGAIVVAYTIAHDLSDIFQCIPVESLWDPTMSARCINFKLQILIMGIIGMCTDIVIFAMPMVPVWHLKLPKAKKWQLSGLFLVGGLYVIPLLESLNLLLEFSSSFILLTKIGYSVCIVSIVRPFYIQKFGSCDATCSFLPSSY